MSIDWKNLFLSAKGRIGRQTFWVGFAVLFAVGFVLGMMPIIGLVASIVIIYPWVCLFSKRLHDMGQSGWLTLVPYVLMIGGCILAGVLYGSSLGAAMVAAQDGTLNNQAAAMAAMGSVGGFVGIMGLVFLLNVAFLIWVGATPGTKGDNAHGANPLAS